jgi:hypothetical protein
MLFFNLALQASNSDQHALAQYASVRISRAAFLVGNEDARIATLTACALQLGQPKLTRAELKECRNALMIHYETAPEDDEILQVLNQIKINHKRGPLNPFGVIFASTLNKERIDLRRVVEARMNAEKKAEDQEYRQSSTPIIATIISSDNNENNSKIYE